MKSKHFGKWSLNEADGIVTYDGEYVAYLSYQEMIIFSTIVRAYPDPITPMKLQRSTYSAYNSNRTRISQIRAKIGYDVIQSIGPNYGYRLNPEAKPPSHDKAS